MSERPVLLGIFAHPDDESFGCGGTLARYAAQGVDVHIIIATDGIAGSVDNDNRLQGHEDLAAVRFQELTAAAAALGATGLWRLPHRDSGMQGTAENQHPAALVQQPMEQLVQELTAYMRRLRPQVVITHDPHGGYGHPDHIMCSMAATAAFYVAGDAHYACPDPDRAGELAPFVPQALYYSTLSKRILGWVIPIIRLFRGNPRAFGRNKDIDLLEISQWETPVTAKVDVAAYLEIKQVASRAHASQYNGGPAFMERIPGFVRRRVLGRESYTQVYPAPQGVTTDLFAPVH